MSPTKILWPAALLLLAAPLPAAAAMTVFTGEDLMTTINDPHPTSDAAAALFDAALVNAGRIDFESAPTGAFSSMTIAPGVTLSGTNTSILNSPSFPAAPTLDGYNTTPGGAQYLEMQPGQATFTFDTPIEAFGAYFTGLQGFFFQDSITFSDGSSQTINIPLAGTESGSPGALSFVGFIDPGAQITSVTINASPIGQGGDFIGVDDVRFSVPEPATWALMVLGFGGAGFALRRRRAAAIGLA